MFSASLSIHVLFISITVMSLVEVEECGGERHRTVCER
jgi:hypothetical protein